MAPCRTWRFFCRLPHLPLLRFQQAHFHQGSPASRGDNRDAHIGETSHMRRKHRRHALLHQAFRIARTAQHTRQTTISQHPTAHETGSHAAGASASAATTTKKKTTTKKTKKTKKKQKQTKNSSS